MTNGAWNVEVHDPLVGRGSLLFARSGLTGAEAAIVMERHSDKALLLRQRGQATAADHAALYSYQVRTGKRLTPHL